MSTKKYLILKPGNEERWRLPDSADLHLLQKELEVNMTKGSVFSVDVLIGKRRTPLLIHGDRLITATTAELDSTAASF